MNVTDVVYFFFISSAIADTMSYFSQIIMTFIFDRLTKTWMSYILVLTVLSS